MGQVTRPLRRQRSNNYCIRTAAARITSAVGDNTLLVFIGLINWRFLFISLINVIGNLLSASAKDYLCDKWALCDALTTFGPVGRGLCVAVSATYLYLWISLRGLYKFFIFEKTCASCRIAGNTKQRLTSPRENKHNLIYMKKKTCGQ